MEVLELSGTAREIGLATGEALRETIQARYQQFFAQARARESQYEARLAHHVSSLRSALPNLFEEMEATAEGAKMKFSEFAALDLPLYSNAIVTEACSNVGFKDGPDGPIWGKNNDGQYEERSKQQPVVCRIIRPNQGIPSISFTFAGSISVGDGMNAEGLAMGHSSVGSVFQMSDHHVPVRLWAHEGLQTCSTTSEFANHMAARPTRGKGYAWVVVDRARSVISLEVACPLCQVRRSAHPLGHVQCVNLYQLPHLLEADRRKPTAKILNQKRCATLDATLAEPGPFDLNRMKGILAGHKSPGMCRHGGEDASHTEYSMIGLPKSGKVLYCHGYPCRNTYQELSI